MKENVSYLDPEDRCEPNRGRTSKKGALKRQDLTGGSLCCGVFFV